MKFKEYWDNHGARFCSLSHEARAEHAWNYAQYLHMADLIVIKRMIKNLDSPNMSYAIAIDDVLVEITRIINENH